MSEESNPSPIDQAIELLSEARGALIAAKMIRAANTDYRADYHSCADEIEACRKAIKETVSLIFPDLVVLPKGEMEQFRRKHHVCEDGWYSCPKSIEGCLDEKAGKDCNCGADKVNELIDKVLSSLTEAQGK